VCPLVCRPLLLILGQDSDEFAAEVGDVGDDAAPDQVKIGCGYLVSLSSGPLWWPRIAQPPHWCAHGCIRDRLYGREVTALEVAAL
jgi:hypothetical protein